MKTRVLYDPLRDTQQQTPAWFCPRCGQEQYATDHRYGGAGQDLCGDCCRRLGREEQEQYHEII